VETADAAERQPKEGRTSFMSSPIESFSRTLAFVDVQRSSVINSSPGLTFLKKAAETHDSEKPDMGSIIKTKSQSIALNSFERD
jgi:hypothetical protein